MRNYAACVTNIDCEEMKPKQAIANLKTNKLHGIVNKVGRQYTQYTVQPLEIRNLKHRKKELNLNFVNLLLPGADGVVFQNYCLIGLTWDLLSNNNLGAHSNIRIEQAK